MIEIVIGYLQDDELAARTVRKRGMRIGPPSGRPDAAGQTWCSHCTLTGQLMLVCGILLRARNPPGGESSVP